INGRSENNFPVLAHKFETRSTKSETNPKYEGSMIQTNASHGRCCFGHSYLGFDIYFVPARRDRI
ncbi:MAG: hypothetical protein OES79_01265, partial [Planctomycetota bacterium]|nr:hypothetical protein [Planctomycetota bacterium]